MHCRKALSERETEFMPSSMTESLDLCELFGREAPLQVDLGCGDGAFLAALAAGIPEQNFLGIERLFGRVRSVCRKAGRLQLGNVRVVRVDVADAVARLLPEAGVSAFHLLFPDPWPKRRHHRRRTATPEFIQHLHRLLVSGGLLHVATDHAEYFDEINRATQVHFEKSDETFEFPRGTFEQRFAAAGTPIYRLLLRKASPVR